MHTKKFIKTVLYLLFLLFVDSNCVAQQAQENERVVDRLLAFAKLSGSIEYFSPADAVNYAYLGFGWSHIYIHGARLAMEVQDDRAFADSLVSLFRPLEPSLYLAYKEDMLSFPPAIQTAPLVISTQHIGLDLHAATRPFFKSVRTNRRSLFSDSRLSKVSFVNIKLPRNTDGQEFKVDMFYNTRDAKHAQLFQNQSLLIEKQLLANDSVFSVKGTVNGNEEILSIMLALDEFDDFGLRCDEFIEIGGKKYVMSGLLDTTLSKQNVYELKITGNDLPLYPERNLIGDTLRLKLSSGISASFPLAVYGDEENTYPLSNYNAEDYPYNKGAITKFRDDDVLDRMDVKLANAIQIWNIFRLSHVYNPHDAKGEEQLFRKTMRNILTARTIEEYEKIMWDMLATYGGDGHIDFQIGQLRSRHSHSVPISVYPVGNHYYVLNIHEDSLAGKVRPGDELVAIDGQPVQESVKKHAYKNAGGQGYRRIGLMHSLLYGKKDSRVDLEFISPEGGISTVSAARSFRHKVRFQNTYALPRTDNRMLSAETYYFNLTQGELTDTLLRFINDPSKNVIFDLRGYLSRSSEEKKLLEKLLVDTVITDNLFEYFILSPERRWFVPSRGVYIPENPGPKAKFYFLVDASAISASETFLDIVKHWNIGKLVGQPTAGANGDVNYIYLPGDITVVFSGIKVLNSDGSTHVGRGVIPHHIVDFSREDLIMGHDPFIERAMQLIGSKVGM